MGFVMVFVNSAKCCSPIMAESQIPVNSLKCRSPTMAKSQNLGEILTDMRGEEVVFVMSGLHNDEIFTEILLIEKMR